MSNIKAGDIVEPISPRLGLPRGSKWRVTARIGNDCEPEPKQAIDPDTLVAQAAQALDNAKELQARARRKAEVIRRIEADKRLAGATLSLLSEIANLNAGLPDRPADSLVAAHATQLDPLARSYGYKVAKAGSIVVVTKA